MQPSPTSAHQSWRTGASKELLSDSAMLWTHLRRFRARLASPHDGELKRPSKTRTRGSVFRGDRLAPPRSLRFFSGDLVKGRRPRNPGPGCQCAQELGGVDRFAEVAVSPRGQRGSSVLG